MSIIDYTKKLTMFDSYDIRMIEMMIDQLKLKENPDFAFLNEISLSEVQIYWYTDSDKNVLGGFHLFSFNVIYINEVNWNTLQTLKYANKAQKIIQVFPIVIHELCHYWQFKKNPIAYLFLQLPFIRDWTIEKQTYKIQDYLHQNNVFTGMNIKQVAEMKKKYGFYSYEFDQKQLRLMNN